MQNYASLQEAYDNEEQGILYHVAEPTRSKWNHIEDLDSFFSRMYKYHQKHGFLCMFLQGSFEIFQFMFVIMLTTYLVYGIDYQVLFNYNHNVTKPTLPDVILPIGKCVANFGVIWWCLMIVAGAALSLKFLNKCYQIIHFWDIKQFYNTALGIEDKNLDNLTWHDIAMKIKAVQLEQQMCIHKRELTELDIYHRILRQENYFVAMVNKKLLPPRMRIPFNGEVVYWTKSLRYNIQALLFWSPWAPFENPYHLREDYKKPHLRHELAKQLGTQILWLAGLNTMFIPILAVWQFLFTVFGYAEVLRREPGRIGIRFWSLYAKLYLRHFNELDHELHARLTRAYRPASKYLAAFSSPIMTIIAQHVGFMCGALFAVILALALYDEDVLALEHVLTLMTVLGSVVGICHTIIPDETMVWCPETLLQNVVMHTHYLPPNWKGQAHTSKIREEFQQLFPYRVTTLLEELVSSIMTPYFLVAWLYPRRLDIVDFFRNFTVSVVGVGDVCSFAQMDVKKHGNPDWQIKEATGSAEVPDQYAQGENGKVELSLVHFATTNPTWIPPPEAEEFIETVNEESEPYYEQSDMIFNSFQNMMGSSSLYDNMQTPSAMNFKSRMNSLANARASRYDGTQSQTRGITSRPLRQSVYMSEGPDVMSPIAMTTSAVALHDRYHNRLSLSVRSVEETTPLLKPKPTL
ncbi:unnamed protein product [Acanthoscelides obtectus]|uniref:Autophagy-related protein 9 n=1 Tax=Acanthoscelides obtectus TaxID=200917 RepID=A0A9P0PSS8_ACAOB|nr:unnamed protein product [Acanthoscelides obtectus]CAK1673291.1 Autophagy-related protein 9A [Acanthoscelides obtectus]